MFAKPKNTQCSLLQAYKLSTLYVSTAKRWVQQTQKYLGKAATH